MSLLLAVDAGGTSTRAVVLDPSGWCHGYGTAGGGNPISSGVESAGASVRAAVQQALTTAGRSPRDVESAVLAMAGARTHQRTGGDAADDRSALDVAGIAFVIESDLLATFCSGTPSPDGYAVVAGTGAAAISVASGRVEAVADGMGWLLGDAGSGFWIGREVVRAAVADLDGRGPATELTGLVLDASGVVDRSSASGGRSSALHQLVDSLYSTRPILLARFASLAFAAAGDETAHGIVDAAAAALVDTLDAVLDQGIDGPLVLGGSVLLRQQSMANALSAAWHERSRTARIHPVADGTVGAAVLALRHDEVAVDADVFARVGDSLAALR